MKKSVIGVVALASIALVAVAVAKSRSSHSQKTAGDAAQVAETVDQPVAE